MLRYLYSFLQGVPTHIDRDYHEILDYASPYYGQLQSDLQRRFRLRVYRFLSTVAFSGLQGIEVVKRPMRVVIAGAFTQITFGLETYLPRRFKLIYVLPRRYAYPGYGEPFLGHIDYKQRAMYFSWEDVLEGFAIPHDAINVALHEMAHLLEAEEAGSILEARFFDEVSWEQWAAVATHKLSIIRTGQSHFIKQYAGQNMREMFASCIETFFEQPDAFYRELPHIYKALARLLCQDPRKQSNPLHYG